MNQHLLVFPMTIYVLWLIAISVFMLRVRVSAVKKGQVTAKYFKSYVSGADAIPDLVIRTGRHYDNQFQVPMLFFVTCTLFITLNQVSYFTVATAWIFVVSRVIHTLIHLGSNKLPKRMLSFAVSWAAVALMWAQLGLWALRVSLQS